MKVKNFEYDINLGVIKTKITGIKSSELEENQKLQEMELPNGTPSLVFESLDAVLDLSLMPIIQFTENEISLYTEDNVVPCTELIFIDGNTASILVPFKDFEKFYFEYKRVKLG